MEGRQEFIYIQRMKRSLVFTLLLIVNNCFALSKKETIEIAIPETYELSNIILAITPYGISDKWEVMKGTAYYNEVMEYFKPYQNHPLIEKVNYSREKWDYYLSFRTDAYAFQFDKEGKLSRRVEFKAQDPMNEFENNLTLVEDFAKVSGFREFYRRHKPYYDSLIYSYSKYQMIPEVLSFLKSEFKVSKNQLSYSIVASPLVGRMNCHRDIEEIPTDFISLPTFVVQNNLGQTPSEREIASGIHMLFTEADHGFVNPTTEHFKRMVKKSFNPVKWDNESGYLEYEFAVFNEYMTWAVYDVFIHKTFPQVATEVCVEWAKQNESRGFIESTLFNTKLIELYQAKAANETIHDLYPKMLKWCKEVEERK